MLLQFLQLKIKQNQITLNTKTQVYFTYNYKYEDIHINTDEREFADMEIKFNVHFCFWAAMYIYNTKIL